MQLRVNSNCLILTLLFSCKLLHEYVHDMTTVTMSTRFEQMRKSKPKQKSKLVQLVTICPSSKNGKVV